jgi:hypothetical protein
MSTGISVKRVMRHVATQNDSGLADVAGSTPLVAWIGSSTPSVAGVRMVTCTTLEDIAQLPELPEVVVLEEQACGWSLDDCLLQARLPALVQITVVVMAQQWSSQLLWRGAQAGVFCCLTRDTPQADLASALKAAAVDAFSRRRRLMPPHDLRGAGHCLTSARFRFRTLEDTETLSILIAAAMPHPERRMGGVLELLINAVEHGNLGVTFAEKRALLLSGALHHTLTERLQNEPYASRYGEVSVERSFDRVRLTIRDQGDGFDFRKFLASTPDLTAPHGRGIYLAKAMSFDRLWYEEPGNCVVAEVDIS